MWGSRKAHVGFQLLGWPHPERQHDVAELIDFLNPRLSALHVTGQVDSREQTPAGVRTQFEGTATRCIRLIRPPQHKPALQGLINFWHSQDSMQALSRPDPWLFLQVSQLMLVKGRSQQSRQTYHCAHHLQVHLQQCGGPRSDVSAYKQHHGYRVDSGHYTTMQVKRDRSLWRLDDEKSPEPICD